MTVNQPPPPSGSSQPSSIPAPVNPVAPVAETPPSGSERQQDILEGPETKENPSTSPSSTPKNEPQEEPSEEEELGPSQLLAAFPVAKLIKLEELISNTRWVIPVLPKAELEMLLDASIQLARHGLDGDSEHCQRFYREGLLTSFTKIMTDDAVSSWRLDIHRCILKNTERLVELCVLKLNDDWFPTLDLLSLVMNPGNKFHVYNAARAAEHDFSTLPPADTIVGIPGAPLAASNFEYRPFAKSVDSRNPRGWLVDLINRFGYFGGFSRLLERFGNESGLTVPLIHALIRPFGQCADLLTQSTLQAYLTPIVDTVPKYLENLTDDELKKETKMEAKNDAVSTIIKSLKVLAAAVPNQEEYVRNLEMFRLKMILRQLQVSSFGGKMNALNEVNRVITSVAYYAQRHPTVPAPSGEEEDYLTADRMAAWLKENKVLQITLQDSLHQPQYVEKLEKVIRFIIKEKALSLEDLDDIWAAQVGQHEAIVKNVHELLAKLAWDFSAEQLDRLFDCFQSSWSTATPKQREKLLELIRRLAEDDKDGVMAEKVLTLFWSLAHNEDTTIELMDQALGAHVKILDYSCTQYRESQKSRWLEKCIKELKDNKNWVLPALKQIREICCLYQESPQNGGGGPHGGSQRQPATHYRQEIINQLQSNHALVILVADNLTQYIDEVRRQPEKIRMGDPADFFPDGRYNHLSHVQERLSFLRFLLKDGQLWLCAPQAKQIWTCLAEQSVFSHDREACFKWFSKLMGEEPDLDPEINRDFFENNILQLDPALMTESGIRCFDRFFKAVNSKENKLIPKRRAFLMDDLELIGLDYIWRLVLCQNEDIADRAIDLLKETFTNLGPRLLGSQVEIHEDFISSCKDRLKAAYDTISILAGDNDSKGDEEAENKLAQEMTRLCRVLKVLHEYVLECDSDYNEERSFVPLYRASRGKQIGLSIRFPNQGRQLDDLDLWTHSNETLGSLRRQIIQRLKVSPSNVKLELFFNGDLVDTADDRKILGDTPIKDKSVLTAKITTANTGGGNLVSSPDSSSDSSTSSPRHAHYEGGAGGAGGPNVEVEQCLPGVIISMQKTYTSFLLQLADLGSNRGNIALMEGARAVLKLIPADQHTIERLKLTCRKGQTKEGQGHTAAAIWENIFFSSSPSQTLYNLEVTCSLLLPGSGYTSDATVDFQLAFIKAKGIAAVIAMLTRNNFLVGADLATKRSAYLTLLKMCKLLFAVAGNSLVHMVAEACQPESTSSVTTSVHNQAVVLQQALMHLPNPNQEVIVRNICQRLAPQLLELGASCLPKQEAVTAIIRIAWAAAAGDLALMLATPDEIHARFTSSNTVAALVQLDSEAMEEETSQEISLCCEALEVLTLAISLHPSCLEVLNKDKSWHNFIVDLVLLIDCPPIRVTAAEQFALIADKCSGEQQPLRFFQTLLFTVLQSSVPENPSRCPQYFYLLSRLLSAASTRHIQLPAAEALLSTEIKWLKKVREHARTHGEPGVEDNLLEGHLIICRELLSFMTPEKKLEVGSSNKSGINLVRDLIDDFLFPASKVIVIYRHSGEVPMSQVQPVCTSPGTTMAAFDLLVGLCTGCGPNLRLVSSILSEMFYTDMEDALTEWEYYPPIGPRPKNGFVGLKNAGATCYMNSVLQQLFMIDGIREGILSAEGACRDPDEDFSGEDRDETNDADVVDDEQNRKEYNILILKQVQAIFAHLASTRLQFYTPKGLWRHFRMMAGEPVNLREQQDAVEFFMRLLDLVDEALKALGYEQKMTQVLGGLYSDQKICKTCPHRYSREQPFSVISLDIKNFNNLTDSLHEYVKGELLDGSNAYYCERCDKKVDTIKRLCVKRLPPILVIQLKRFDYDYERESAIKFNDYFEFPRDLDMDPYTVAGLAKIEGESMDDEESDGAEENPTTQYKLRGMVVHSGQASGGHYYSYIQCKGADGNYAWYKFDDGEVSEIKMEDDEELKAQCYGGEYTSEVFDPMAKRMSYRKQKRWWNAYMLFYTRVDQEETSGLAAKMASLNLDSKVKNISSAAVSPVAVALSPMKAMGSGEERTKSKSKVPAPIERSIQKQNVRFLHHRNQFSPEYFQFMRKLISCNAHYVTPSQQQQVSSPNRMSTDAEELALHTVQLASRFLFSAGFRSKKTLRGPAHEWYELLTTHLRGSRVVRLWFCQKILFSNPAFFCEYILECPTSEVRTAFVRIIVFVAHFSLGDGPCPPPAILQQLGNKVDTSVGSTLSDHLLQTILALLWMEVSEHGRHLPQYFSLFVMYASLGAAEKAQLLKLNVPAVFIQVALDEGPGPPIKYQYTELAKLYQVVSQLVRCCDVTSKCKSALEGQAVLPNPHIEPSCPNGTSLMELQPQVEELLFTRFNYLKKLIEEGNSLEDTKLLLMFCSWENPTFSHAVLHELLWQIAIAYTHELRPYLELLLAVLTLEDSWQTLRIVKSLRGIPDDQTAKEGLFDTIQRSKTHYQKRAYQCIKLLVTLFSTCPAAREILDTQVDVKRKWVWSVEWLTEELEQRGRPGFAQGQGQGQQGSGGQYSYSNWSPPAQSNESVNGYFLERSHSARLTLEKAVELVPDEDPERIEESSSPSATATNSTNVTTRSSNRTNMTTTTDDPVLTEPDQTSTGSPSNRSLTNLSKGDQANPVKQTE